MKLKLVEIKLMTTLIFFWDGCFEHTIVLKVVVYNYKEWHFGIPKWKEISI